jgi:hypothetical protein
LPPPLIVNASLLHNLIVHLVEASPCLATDRGHSRESPTPRANPP